MNVGGINPLPFGLMLLLTAPIAVASTSNQPSESYAMRVSPWSSSWALGALLPCAWQSIQHATLSKPGHSRCRCWTGSAPDWLSCGAKLTTAHQVARDTCGDMARQAGTGSTRRASCYGSVSGTPRLAVPPDRLSRFGQSGYCQWRRPTSRPD